MSEPIPFSIGEIVESEVELSAHHGLFCQCRGHRVYVDIIDLSYTAWVNSAAQFASSGDRFMG